MSLPVWCVCLPCVSLCDSWPATSGPVGGSPASRWPEYQQSVGGMRVGLAQAPSACHPGGSLAAFPGNSTWGLLAPEQTMQRIDSRTRLPAGQRSRRRQPPRPVPVRGGRRATNWASAKVAPLEHASGTGRPCSACALVARRAGSPASSLLVREHRRRTCDTARGPAGSELSRGAGLQSAGPNWTRNCGREAARNSSRNSSRETRACSSRPSGFAPGRLDEARTPARQ